MNGPVHSITETRRFNAEHLTKTAFAANAVKLEFNYFSQLNVTLWAIDISIPFLPCKSQA